MRRTVTLITAIAVVSVGLWGCAGMGGKKPEEVVMDRTQAFANDFTAGNADKLLDYVSESFTNEHVASKAEVAKHIQKAKDEGKIAEYTQMIKDHHGVIDLKQAKVKIEKGVATIYPITASADEGSVTVELKYKQDKDKVWRIVAINIEGI